MVLINRVMVKIRYVVFLNSINYHILNFLLNRLIKYLDYI